MMHWMRSAEVFAHYFKLVHCVDPWLMPGYPTTLEDSFDERAALAGNIVKHKARSLELAPTICDASLDFVYIDALHDYDNVLADIRAWSPKVRAEAFIGGHDYDLPDVRKAIADSLGVEPHLFSDHSWIIRKT